MRSLLVLCSHPVVPFGSRDLSRLCSILARSLLWVPLERWDLVGTLRGSEHRPFSNNEEVYSQDRTRPRGSSTRSSPDPKLLPLGSHTAISSSPRAYQPRVCKVVSNDFREGKNHPLLTRVYGVCCFPSGHCERESCRS